MKRQRNRAAVRLLIPALFITSCGGSRVITTASTDVDTSAESTAAPATTALELRTSQRLCAEYAVDQGLEVITFGVTALDSSLPELGDEVEVVEPWVGRLQVASCSTQCSLERPIDESNCIHSTGRATVYLDVSGRVVAREQTSMSSERSAAGSERS